MGFSSFLSASSFRVFKDLRMLLLDAGLLDVFALGGSGEDPPFVAIPRYVPTHLPGLDADEESSAGRDEPLRSCRG